MIEETHSGEIGVTGVSVIDGKTPGTFLLGWIPEVTSPRERRIDRKLKTVTLVFGLLKKGRTWDGIVELRCGSSDVEDRPSRRGSKGRCTEGGGRGRRSTTSTDVRTCREQSRES